ncbi:hypothetical protein FHS68_002447 [Dyadobacter arcticus]|uniref:Uncharacterized protein n=1 Tax=Dyadobacter arcticus TaxID=1078754 RepID=A0ABX0UK35_9BACT|nr:hypothetical protein [Dyadobacter arcticus]
MGIKLHKEGAEICFQTVFTHLFDILLWLWIWHIFVKSLIRFIYQET